MTSSDFTVHSVHVSPTINASVLCQPLTSEMSFHGNDCKKYLNYHRPRREMKQNDGNVAKWRHTLRPLGITLSKCFVHSPEIVGC